MKLVRYSRKHESPTLARAGVVVAQDLVADLKAGYALYLVEETGHAKGRELAAIYLPPYLAQFLHAGEPAWLALADAYSYLAGLAPGAPDALGLSGEQLFIPAAECRFYAPVRPSKLFAVEGNYAAPGARRPAGRVPSGCLKPQSSLIGAGRDIVKPVAVRDLGCDTALAVVIGKKCKHVREEDAYGVIAGYTIVNDVTARDVSRLERDGGQALLARTYDTFCAMGPWLMTREAIPDPMRLALGTRVNGEPRQAGNTKDMLWTIPQLVAYFSQVTLMPGDVIATGSPGGAPDESVPSLQVGDVIESEVEGIGVLRNAVVDEPRS